MRTRINAFRVAVTFILWALAVFQGLAERKIQWQTGLLVSTDVSGHGPQQGSAAPGSSKKVDIWWAYCITAGEMTYSVVSRESPAKSGLRANSPIQFTVEKTRMTIVNPKGDRHAFKIARQGKGTACR